MVDRMGKDAPNTTIYREQDGSLSVVLHRTAVVNYRQDGTVRFTSGGYRTRTTKDRLNRFGPEGLTFWQRDFEWFWGHKGSPDEANPFGDGMVLAQDAATGRWAEVTP